MVFLFLRYTLLPYTCGNDITWIFCANIFCRWDFSPKFTKPELPAWPNGNFQRYRITKVLVQTQPFSWIYCLRWFFMDCTMVNQCKSPSNHHLGEHFLTCFKHRTCKFKFLNMVSLQSTGFSFERMDSSWIFFDCFVFLFAGDSYTNSIHGMKIEMEQITMWAILCLVPKHGGWSLPSRSFKNIPGTRNIHFKMVVSVGWFQTFT